RALRPAPSPARGSDAMQRILVVEDDMQISRTLRDYLEVAGYDVTIVGDGSAARSSARGDPPDLLVLDLGLPSVDGLDVAREVRRASTTPIIMLTARGEESDRIVGLELRADACPVKPFSPKELVARVRAVPRRARRVRMGAPSASRARTPTWSSRSAPRSSWPGCVRSCGGRAARPPAPRS